MTENGLLGRWSLYNLTGSPYFQGYLRSDSASQTSRPLSLFVGRETDVQGIMGRILGAGNHGSRQTIVGRLGIGKTTIVQQVKAKLAQRGYLTRD